MKKTPKKILIPDITEFTDEEGKKWVQTSTDDLFSMKELNEILESIDKDEDKGDIVLARIDFQKVNKEYYDTAIKLQKKLNKQTELLRKVVTQSKETIERKNKKLKELIDHIRKLHTLLAQLSSGNEGGEIKLPPISFEAAPAQEEEIKVGYEDVTEVELIIDDNVEKQFKG
ncbi:MAG: hypothetical protein GY754_36735 [bacterium]|nr:hypothetical protein [bacterium]